MGRKNNKARERTTTPESTERMIQRLQRENSIYKAHKTKAEFQEGFVVGSLVEWDRVKKELFK